jgi:hypothetical protein
MAGSATTRIVVSVVDDDEEDDSIASANCRVDNRNLGAGASDGPRNEGATLKLTTPGRVGAGTGSLLLLLLLLPPLLVGSIIGVANVSSPEATKVDSGAGGGGGAGMTTGVGGSTKEVVSGAGGGGGAGMTTGVGGSTKACVLPVFVALEDDD